MRWISGNPSWISISTVSLAMRSSMPLKTRLKTSRSGPRFTPSQRQDIMACVQTMRHRGYTQMEIGNALGISQKQVSDYLTKIADWYRTATLAEVHAMRLEKLEQYNDLVREAWEAWQRSQEDRERIVTEEEPVIQCPACRGTKVVKHKVTKLQVACFKCKATGVLGGVLGTTRTREGQVGDPRFLQILKGIHDSVSDLLGLNLGDKGGSTFNILNWDQIAGESGHQGRPRPLGADKLAAVEALPLTAPPPPTVGALEEPSPSAEPGGQGQPSSAAVSDSETLSSGGTAPPGGEVPHANGTNGTAKPRKRYR